MRGKRYLVLLSNLAKDQSARFFALDVSPILLTVNFIEMEKSESLGFSKTTLPDFCNSSKVWVLHLNPPDKRPAGRLLCL